MPAFNRAANVGCAFFVLTDLDIHVPCPGQLLGHWLRDRPSRNLLFRVAVKEVEAWLLADRANIAQFLEVDATKIPSNPEAVPDPKREIVRLARGSALDAIVSELVPLPDSTAAVGRGFQQCLLGFVRDHWDIAAAARHSRSLKKSLEAIRRF